MSPQNRRNTIEPQNENPTKTTTPPPQRAPLYAQASSTFHKSISKNETTFGLSVQYMPKARVARGRHNRPSTKAHKPTASSSITERGLVFVGLFAHIIVLPRESRGGETSAYVEAAISLSFSLSLRQRESNKAPRARKASPARDELMLKSISAQIMV